MSSVINTFIYTPLEQFDNVSWAWSFVRETRDTLSLSVLPNLFDAWELSAHPFVGTTVFGSGRIGSYGTLIIGVALYSFYRAGLFESKESFQILPALFRIHLLTGGFIVVWFRDLLVFVESGFITLPQISVSFYMDERLVTLILAFFLLGGGEEEEDEDFLLKGYENDVDRVEVIVAPLFVANLGNNFEGNGALYLKVCAIFGFVFANNARGRMPYADTATSSLGLTFWVALATFASLVTIRISRNGFTYFLNLFRPAGCPFPLLFLLIPIEFLSYSFRLVSLSVRLFANRRAGHTLRKVLIGFSYTRFLIGDGYILLGFLPGLVVFILIFLERAVAVIQAYIFTILICMYLKDIFVGHLSV